MDVLTHFRSIEELTKTLSREQKLLSEMFEKRKLMKFPLGLAIDLVGGNEVRLRKLIEYGVLVESGNTVEIESDYLNFFEEVLNVNEEISVLSVQECINTLKEHIGYFLQETNPNRKAGYQDNVRQLLKKTGFRTLKNVVDLKRNMDNAYKQEPNYIIKKKKYKGEWHDIEEILFKGYVFMISDDIDRLYQELKKVPEITKMLGRKDKIIYPIEDKEVEFISEFAKDNHKIDMSYGFIVDDKITITEGPLEGKEGMIKKIDRHKRKAVIEISFLNQIVMAEVGLEIISKVSSENK